MAVLLAGSECTISSFANAPFSRTDRCFFVSENRSSCENAFLVLLSDKVQGVKPPAADNLIRSDLFLKANPKLMQDQGKVLVLNVGCYLATSSQLWGLS